MEWKNDKVLNLIELYRNRPVLWDCQIKKIDALTEIAVILQIQRDEIERKIKNLVCHFSRELKKEKECKKVRCGK
ncbi:hypothetical protein NQ318_007378 [Aromia moschata]|uniref:MADF domain-containing protein n=1 Tax=Aromia moschata TaxID=1265417 RepID=A0AAV8YGH3_9CUCU|nr:hypothetical protein NQ318_007378 [Aromia moschata]